MSLVLAEVVRSTNSAAEERNSVGCYQKALIL